MVNPINVTVTKVYEYAGLRVVLSFDGEGQLNSLYINDQGQTSFRIGPIASLTKAQLDDLLTVLRQAGVVT